MDQSLTSPERTAGSRSVVSEWRFRAPAGRGSQLGVLLVCVAIWLVVLWSIYALPPAGALLSLAAFVTVVPLAGSDLSARLVSSVIVGAGLLGLLLALGDTFEFRVLTLGRLQMAFLVPATVAMVLITLAVARRAAIHVARVDAATVPLLIMMAMGWWVAGYPAHGVDLGDTVGGLMLLGWDHQSHFTIFSYLEEQRGVWRTGPPDAASLFLDYPPLAGAMAVSIATLLGLPSAEPPQLMANYVQTSAAMFGLAAGLMAWTAARVGAQIVRGASRAAHAGAVVTFSGLVVGGYVVLGPTNAFFDYGFTNFFLAISLATATSWMVIAELEYAPGRASGVLVAGAAAMGLLWTPLVLLMVPAGLVLTARMARGRRWGTLVCAAVVAGAGAWVAFWQVSRIVPDGPAATSIAQTLAAVGGGQPAVPVPHLVLLIILSIAVARGRRKVGALWWAPLTMPIAAGVITLAFAINSVRAGFPVLDSYYVAKAVWIVYLALLPLLGALTAVCMLAVLRHTEPQGRPSTATRLLGVTKTVGIGLTALAVTWLSTPTENAPNGSIDYYAIPVGGQAVLDRWGAFRNVPQGDVVATAYQKTKARPHRTVVVWDGGDLLTNRWVASLRGDLTADTDALYTSMPSPYAESARTAMEQALEARPELHLMIVASAPTREFLRPLRQQYPGRLAFGRI